MQPKEYVRPMPGLWWTRNRYLVQFMIRELTAVFVGGYAVFLLALLALDREQFYNVLHSPLSLVLQVICLLFAIYHSVTWFNLTPKALVLWHGDEKVSPVLIAGVNYGVWVVVSIVIFYALLP